jgi:hypothetical protein
LRNVSHHRALSYTKKALQIWSLYLKATSPAEFHLKFRGTLQRQKIRPKKDIFHFGKVSQIRVAFTYKYELQTMWLSSKETLLPLSCRLSRTSDLRSIPNWEWKFASSMLCQCRLINRQSPF